MTFHRLAMIWLLVMVAASVAAGQEGRVLFREDFGSLANWRPLTFPKIEKQTVYTIESDGGTHYLKAVSTASASALVFKNEFDVYRYPKVKWRWKVSRVYEKGDSGGKSGDDYPIRVYVLFKYDPDRTSAFDRLTYGVTKALYGEYPPHSTLNYVWANKDDQKDLFTSPYTGRAKLVALEKGSKYAGVWRDEAVDVLADYRRAFGTDPPSTASLAIMNDSDNTGERSVSYVAYIEVSGKGEDGN